MPTLKLLIVEGNSKEENVNFNHAGCIPQSENFKLHIEGLESNCNIDIAEPGNEDSISKVFSSIKKYDGVVLTGSTLRIENKSMEVKKHKLFKSKPHKFTTPAFNYDEVETPPNNAVLLASNKINKFGALYFTVGKSEIWGLQYHPEIPYDYMIKLIKNRSKGLIEKNIFKNEFEINLHINSIQKAKTELSDELRTMELKNWLDYIKG